MIKWTTKKKQITHFRRRYLNLLNKKVCQVHIPEPVQTVVW